MGGRAAARKKIADTQVDLPKHPQNGDRIRLKPERMKAYDEAMALAGWNYDRYQVRTVIRQDRFASGGGRRLFVDGPPFCFGGTDVILAWNTEQERREFLRTQGFKV